jgi:hypothetical protein
MLARSIAVIGCVAVSIGAAFKQAGSVKNKAGTCSLCSVVNGIPGLSVSDWEFK